MGKKNIDELIEEAMISVGEQPYKLPENWVWVHIGFLCNIVSGGTPSSSVNEYYVDGTIPWIRPADLSKYDDIYIENGAKNITKLGLSKSSARLIPKNSILLSSRAPIGYVVIAKNDLCTNQGFKNFEPSKAYIPHYGYWYLKHARPLIEELGSGTTFKEVSGKKAALIPFPVAPIEEQRRIVNKIESLFYKIDKAKELIVEAKEEFDNRKAAILVKAFRGELTKKWREENGLGMGNWEETILEKHTSVLGDGIHGTPKYSDDGDYYFINGNNLNGNSIVIKPDTKRVDIEEYEKYKKVLSEQTVFVSINGTLGKTAFYNGESVILGKSACYFNVKETLDKHFIKYYLETQEFLRYAHAMATGSTIKNLSLRAMRNLPLRLPTILEQKQIVLILDSLLEKEQNAKELCDLVENIDQIKKSILAKAFRGELGTNNPTEESAIELLKEVIKEKMK